MLSLLEIELRHNTLWILKFHKKHFCNIKTGNCLRLLGDL